MNFLSSIGWRPGIGDPTFIGWFTVWAYAVAAVLAACAARRSRGDRARLVKGAPKMQTVWIGTTVVLSFLCVNKQLDLQTLLTDIGRAMSKSEGWYGERRVFQETFVFGVLAASGLFALWFSFRFWHFWLSHPLLVGGLLFLLTFVVIRAISFHHVDEFLRISFAGFRMNCLLELTGIFLVALAAGWEIWKTKDMPSLRRIR